MTKQRGFTKALAIAGTILIWLPLLSPILFALIFWSANRVFRFDYLMPAELFPLVLIGGALLLWAAFRACQRRTSIGGGLGSAIGALFASQGLAVVTGLASGRTAANGWEWALVLTLLGLYVLALIVIGVAGVLLVRDLFKPSGSATQTTP